jgi:hypothetical protein
MFDFFILAMATRDIKKSLIQLAMATRDITRISREMGNRSVDFFGVYTITNMLDKNITKFQPKIFSRN